MILDFEDNKKAVADFLAGRDRHERESEERKRLRLKVLHLITTLYGEAGKLRRSTAPSDQTAGEALWARAAAFGERRAALWDAGALDDLQTLLDEVQAAVDGCAKPRRRSRIDHGGCREVLGQRTLTQNLRDTDPKLADTPPYKNLQAADARSGQDAGFVDSDAHDAARQGIAIKHSHALLMGDECSCPPMSSGGAAAGHNLSVLKAKTDRALGEMVADGRAMGADGEADDGIEQESRSARGPRVAMSVPEALATPAGCHGLIAVMPSLADAAGRVEIAGPSDLVAAAERLVETWVNPETVNGKPLNLKSVATAREKLVEVRGTTDASIGEWLLAVAMAANAKGLKMTREVLATGILRNIRAGRFDVSRFPTRDFWCAVEAAGGTATVAAVDVERPAPSQTADIIPLVPLVLPAPKAVEAAVEEIVQDPALAPAPAKVVAVPSAEAPRRPAAAAVPARAPGSGVVTVDKMSPDVLRARFSALRAENAETVAVVETVNPVEDKAAAKPEASVVRSPEMQARLEALKAKCGLGGKPLPLAPVPVSMALPVVDEDTVLPPLVACDDLHDFRADLATSDDQDGEVWDDAWDHEDRDDLDDRAGYGWDEDCPF